MPQIAEVVRKVDVALLSLDLNNYRFAAEQPSEVMAFNYLFDKEDVMSVANSLLREGYRTNEVPLVVEENDRYVVLEANRRVSALRALRDPSLVPNQHEALKKLIKRHQTDADDLPDEIYVTVYPDRASAAPVLARQHIGEDKKRWGLDEQAKFVLAQLTGDVDVKTLRATLTGIKNIVRVVKMGRVRQSLKEITYNDSTLLDYVSSTDLKMSAFEYAYRDRQIRPLLGFEFDSEGDITSCPQGPGEIAVLERLLHGFRSGELSTRKVLNDKNGEAYSTLVAELRTLSGISETSSAKAAAPPPASAGAPSQPNALEGGSGGESATSGAAEDNTANKVGPNSPDSKNKLVITLDYTKTPVGLQKRFIELRSIDLGVHPVAGSVLLRSVVESTIKLHYSKRGNHAVKGMLGQVVPHLATDYGNVGSISQSIRLLQNAIAPQQRPGSGNWFNSASHDPAAVINAQQVRDAWQELEPLLLFLLQDSPAFG
ncbi:hypothetical protein SAMN05421595_2139 [Austwickia chelonae]|uniref:ParB/Sulfiredoxin domain-containing protein n=1 Tax=Austwickia chelonae NBRC 105200 TaxID=1184607 RepID=K6VJY5_9MICO|nr:hypothetical protein [Austwickia chelonae]GAB77004.1 hypothetical protein AUCHE_04_00450 [Austwickia chelonae NBRC 105200]SEW33194.1 hypothetical protein SAMN05421595_2139 [Austwickia chelonae]